MLNFQSNKDSPLSHNSSGSFESFNVVTDKENNKTSTAFFKESKKLLIVGANAKFICNNMIDLNYDCVAFEESIPAVEWLEKIANSAFDLPHAIVCDLELLEGDAYTLFGQVQQNQRLKAVPFIIMSKHFSRLDKVKALETGIDDFYSLPFSAEDLHSRITFLQQFKKEKAELMYSEDQPFENNKFITKRAFDILFSLTCILILSPLLLLIALIIRLESKGPILYISKRVGTGYQIFDFYKFRSMRQGADSELQKLKHMNQYEKEKATNKTLFDDTSFVKISNDPRITKFGNFIRKTSLDELPQLFNVLKGDMSIVGNRPLPLYEAEQLTKDVWAKRFMAPAGITGLWQVTKRGKKEMSVAERMELDIEYANNYSFLMDLKIILKTFPALLQKEQV